MKYFDLNLLVEVPDELSLDDFEYEFRKIIEKYNWSASGEIFEVDENDNKIEGKTRILTLI
jgi:hypothetical protein